MIDFRSDVLDAGPHFRQVGSDLDRHPAALAGGGIQEVNFPQLVVDHSGSIAGEAADVGTVVVESFGNRLRTQVVAEDPDVPGACGEEEDLLAAVDWKEVRSLLVRNLNRVETRKPGDPDRAGAAAAVVTPRHERGVVESEGGSQR